jgi:carboxylesterase type B
MSTAVHLISPLSKGLFHRAIMESDPFSIEIPDLDESEVRNTEFAK